MTKKKIFVPIICIFIISFLVVALVGGISFAANDNNEIFLGKYTEYGIIANFINQTGDMESNFIAAKYQGNGQTCGNTLSSSMANSEGQIKIGELVNGIQVRNKPLVIINTGIKEEVKNAINKIHSYSETVVSKSDYQAPEPNDINEYIIDIRNIEKNVVYVNMDNFVNAVNENKVQNGALKIITAKDQSIILNSNIKNKFNIPRYQIDNGKNKEDTARTVIWNLPNVANLHIASDGINATIIACNAMVNIDVTAQGWLVCDTIVSNNGEWHCISHNIPNYTLAPSPSKTCQTQSPIPTSIECVTTPSVTSTTQPKNTPVTTPTYTAEENVTTETIAPTLLPTIIATEKPKIVSQDTPTPSLLTIKDNDTPKTSLKRVTKKNKKDNQTLLLDDDVPLVSSTPDTGDEIDIITIIMVMTCCLIFIIIVISLNKK